MRKRHQAIDGAEEVSVDRREPPAMRRLRNACRAAEAGALESAREQMRRDRAHFAPGALHATEGELRRRGGYVDAEIEFTPIEKVDAGQKAVFSPLAIVGIGLIGMAVVGMAFLKLVATEGTFGVPIEQDGRTAGPTVAVELDTLETKSVAALWEDIERGGDARCAMAVVELGRRGRLDDLAALVDHRRAAARVAVAKGMLAAGEKGVELIPVVATELGAAEPEVRAAAADGLREMVSRHGVYRTR